MTRKVVSPEERCQILVLGTGPWGVFHRHQCENRAVVVSDGKRYCKIHDPEYIKAKDGEREAKARTKQCPKCHSTPRSWYRYCPSCGTKYPSKLNKALAKAEGREND
jgi:hypothetical protein